MTTTNTKLGTEQELTVLDENNQKESINIETVGGQVHLGTYVTDQYGDESWATVTLDREALWEHIHNCINALEGLK